MADNRGRDGGFRSGRKFDDKKGFGEKKSFGGERKSYG